MKKITFLMMLVTFLAIAAKAQDLGKISGLVQDAKQVPVESATISLLKAADSSTLKFYSSGKDGSFQFTGVATGKYLVAVSSVGHQAAYSPAFEVTAAAQFIQLQPIVLVVTSKSMGGVTVTARKPFIEQKMDRMVVNVEASVTNVGATALEVLEKSPGITVDKDGNISLKGKQGIIVMMDGRPAYLSGTDLTNYLKNLPASALEQIEIMTNPPAKYDAAGNAGVINIKTKKNKTKGFNGNVNLTYSQGFYWKTNNSINLNYRTEKLNLFANASQSYWNSFSNLEIKRTFRNADTKSVSAIFEQLTRMRNQNDYYGLKLGADYYVSKNTTLGFVTNGSLNPSTFKSRTTSYLMNSSRQTDSIAMANVTNNNNWKNGSVNLNFRHQFDSAGTELTSDLDYITYSANGRQNFLNATLTPSGAMLRDKLITSNLPVSIDIYSAKVDFSHPFKSGVKLEAGAKTSFVNTTNSAFYYNVVNEKSAADYTKTNRFNYKENINAVYINVNKEFGKFGLQTGLRYENTSYNGRQFGNPMQTDSLFKRSYGSLFPTIFVSYKAGNKNQFGVSLGRRIGRPAYQDLNPFLFFIDEYTYESGNPFLRPQFTNNLELTHTYNGFLTTTLNYNRTSDNIIQVFNQVQASNTSNGYATVLRRSNIGRVEAAGVAINAQVPVAKWWNANIYTNFNWNRFNGVVDKELINTEAANLLFNINNQFRFGKTWSAELSGFYRTKGVDGQIMIQPMGQASAGISKQILAGKGSLKLNVRDLFYTNKATGNIKFSSTEAFFQNTRDSRVANLTFTYRFGKPLKEAKPRRASGGAGDEQNRVRSGN